jgi:hypothetical protein
MPLLNPVGNSFPAGFFVDGYGAPGCGLNLGATLKSGDHGVPAFTGACRQRKVPSMSRPVLVLLLVSLLLSTRALLADDGPPISITSPDTGVTFAFGAVKQRSLFWDGTDKLLVARVVFTDAQSNEGAPQEDTHEFRLPGVSFDEAKGIFYAVSARGETIPVAHIKKALFFKSIEVLPNAVIRIQHPRGNVTVLLEAVSPNDPAMHAPPTNTNPDATHPMDINSILH